MTATRPLFKIGEVTISQRSTVEILKVIRVDIIFDDNFPISADFIEQIRDFGELLGMMRPHPRWNLPDPLLEGFGIRVGINEDHATPYRDAGRNKPKTSFIDSLERSFFLRNSGKVT